jgi:thiol-disulfide isomerase/thioredoxin
VIAGRRRLVGSWALAGMLGGVGRRAGAQPTPPASTPASEEPVHWPSLTRLDGSPWERPVAADGRPHAVVAVIWLTSCPFCLRHNAHVEKLHRRAAGRPLTVVTAALDREVSAISAYLDRHGYTFPVVREADRLRALFTTRRVIPFTATVGRDGRVRERLPGEMFEDDVLDLLQLAA